MNLTTRIRKGGVPILVIKVHDGEPSDIDRNTIEY